MKALSWIFSGTMAGCALLRNGPGETSGAERAAQFPTANLALRGNALVRWDPHLIPFIEADDDDDVPYVLGLVHAHLRLGQLEMLRRLSQGRLSELAGPFVVDIDKSLRIVGFGRSAAATFAAMEPASKLWTQRFVEGLNLYIERAGGHLPPDLRALGVRRIEPWTPTELITAWKLASTDVNWMVLLRFVKMREKPKVEELWQALRELGIQSTPSFAFDNIPATFGRSGSNSLVVGPKRAKNGAALIASDPHLGLQQPNFWLLGGFRSPSYCVFGMMIPGLPAVALGRNRDAAWGGTNMWGLSTRLIQLEPATLAAAKTTTETIKVRGWFNQSVDIRTTRFGPVISDIPYFEKKAPPMAMQWVGHEVSDELGAFLKANRATRFEDFRKAFATYAISAQNFLYADRHGDIGQIMAYRRPNAPDDSMDKLLYPESAAWTSFTPPTAMPYAKNPASNFIASSNNRPTASGPSVGMFFSSNDRVERLRAVVGGNAQWDVPSLQKLQLDVFSAGAHRLTQLLVKRVKPTFRESLAAKELWRELESWDGNYRKESRGPVAYETLLAALAHRAFSERFGADLVDAAKQSSNVKALVEQIFATTDDATLTQWTEAALGEASSHFCKYPRWGTMHYVQVAHLLGNVPVLGARWRFDEFESDGGSDTLFKTANALDGERNAVSYGANARHITDLSSLDENWFVLLGGQDGWMTSLHTFDQVELWKQHAWIRIPLSDEGRATTFSQVTLLERPAQ